MTEKQTYKHVIAEGIKELLTYAKADDVESKTIIIQAVDLSDELDAVSYAFGDTDTVVHLAQHTVDSLPPEEVVHFLGHMVEDYKEILRDLIELHDNGDANDFN